MKRASTAGLPGVTGRLSVSDSGATREEVQHVFITVLRGTGFSQEDNCVLRYAG